MGQIDLYLGDTARMIDQPLRLESTSFPLRPTLTSLPNEIISSIASHLHGTDALTLTYTSRRFVELTEKALWRSVDLSIHPWYGESPFVWEHEYGLVVNLDAEDIEGKKADKIYASRLRGKIKSMLGAGPRKWGMVENVRLVSRPDGVHSLVQMLDCVSPNLKTLDIDAAPQEIAKRHDGLHDYAELEYSLLEAHLSFPNLTHLRLGPLALRYLQFLPLICNAASRLMSLIVDVESVGRHYLEKNIEGFPPYKRPTHIHHLHLSLSRYDYEILELLAYCYQLEQLSFGGDWMRQKGEDGDFAWLEHDNVRELHCDVFPSRFWAWTKDVYSSFPSLTHSVLRFDPIVDLFFALPELPLLECLYLNGAPCRVGPPTEGVYQRQSSERMLDTLAQGLHNAPKLSSIRKVDLSGFVHELDSNLLTALHEPVYAGTLVGVIRSLIHNGDELLHARLLSDIRVQLDEFVSPFSVPRHPIPPIFVRIYADGDGDQRSRIFEQLPNPVWQDFTYHDGHVVSFEIIDQMLAAEGLKESEWAGRGLEVGQTAWNVLLNSELEQLRELEAGADDV